MMRMEAEVMRGLFQPTVSKMIEVGRTQIENVCTETLRRVRELHTHNNHRDALTDTMKTTVSPFRLQTCPFHRAL